MKDLPKFFGDKANNLQEGNKYYNKNKLELGIMEIQNEKSNCMEIRAWKVWR